MSAQENWDAADAYEQWVGRWSRVAALQFLRWLAAPAGGVWADVGCGTGALAQAICGACAPRRLRGCDRSAPYVTAARARIADACVDLEVADALQLPWADREFDAAVSGLVLNFVPDPVRMVSEMARVTRRDGVVAAYVWDYAGGMRMMREFWDVAIALRPDDARLDQAERFPVCAEQPLRDLFAVCGLRNVAATALEFEMRFRDFDDYWQPFLGGQGAAPAYLATLPAGDRERIRERLRARVERPGCEEVVLTARAWAVRGIVA